MFLFFFSCWEQLFQQQELQSQLLLLQLLLSQVSVASAFIRTSIRKSFDNKAAVTKDKILSIDLEASSF
jgi:hypothetical protein